MGDRHLDPGCSFRLWCPSRDCDSGWRRCGNLDFRAFGGGRRPGRTSGAAAANGL